LAHPAVSRLGTRVAFVRSAPEGHYVEVVDVTSNVPIRLSSTAMDGRPHDFAWSPDERQLAWITGGDLWLARTDGSGAGQVDVGMVVTDVSWRPPDGSELLIRAAPAGLIGLYLLHPDGSDLRPITDIDGSEYLYVEADWSPDGKRLAWSDYPPGIVHVLTIDGLEDVTVPASDGGQGTLFPKWSPDGSKIGLVDWRATGEGRVAIVGAADPTSGMVDVGPPFAQGPDYVWSPDGTRILAIGWNTSQPWLLEPSGGSGQKTTWTLPSSQSIEGGENILANVWQRLSP
jgi:WD40 repeat protein